MCNYVVLHRRLKKTYKKIAPELWWGDDLDVRFYLLKRLIEVKNKRILDVGCNIGIIIKFLDKTNFLCGIDIDLEFCKKAKDFNKNAYIVNGTMKALPFKSNFFDIVIMSNVFPGYEFYESNVDEAVNKTLTEIKRVLKRNGMLLLTTPNKESKPYRKSKKITYNQLSKYIASIGFTFEIYGWNSLFFQPLLPKILSNIEITWRILESLMNRNIGKSKYFFVIAEKR